MGNSGVCEGPAVARSAEPAAASSGGILERAAVEAYVRGAIHLDPGRFRRVHFLFHTDQGWRFRVNDHRLDSNEIVRSCYARVKRVADGLTLKVEE